MQTTTKVSQLENDLKYQTEEEVKQIRPAGLVIEKGAAGKRAENPYDFFTLFFTGAFTLCRYHAHMPQKEKSRTFAAAATNSKGAGLFSKKP
ncbi:hypothetical protein [Allofournierella sp.]|uniref:hypothetical protein n=1 Tax=Allofournierella sp. TaxID=1940256 RepID=UPI003AB5C729